MTKLEHSIVIEAPIKEVFTYASDYQKWNEWFEGVSPFIPTTEITRGNGAKYKYKAKFLGATTTLETEIHDFVENVGWRGAAVKGMEHETYWNFEEIGSNTTKFTYGLEYKLPIPIIGFILDSILMQPQWNKIIKKSLQNLAEKFNQ